jgi:hypothetical protein
MTKSRTLADSGTAFTTVSATELGYVDGVTSAIQTQIDGKQAVNANVSTTELGYLDGVTSAIQTQLDAKTAKATLTTTGDIYYASSASTPARLGIGSSAQVLTVAGGVPSWATPSAAAFVGCSVYKTANQSLTTATLTALSFDAEYYDTNTMHDNTTNNSRITIPASQGGKYLMTGNIAYAPNAGGWRYFFLRINGSNNFYSASNPVLLPFASFPNYMGVSFVLDLAAADYVELFGYQSSGGALDAQGGDKGVTYFQLAKIG